MLGVCWSASVFYGRYLTHWVFNVVVRWRRCRVSQLCVRTSSSCRKERVVGHQTHYITPSRRSFLLTSQCLQGHGVSSCSHRCKFHVMVTISNNNNNTGRATRRYVRRGRSGNFWQGSGKQFWRDKNQDSKRQNEDGFLERVGKLFPTSYGICGGVVSHCSGVRDETLTQMHSGCRKAWKMAKTLRGWKDNLSANLLWLSRYYLQLTRTQQWGGGSRCICEVTGLISATNL